MLPLIVNYIKPTNKIMIITIEGNQGEGKTVLANKLCEGRDAQFLIEGYSIKGDWSDVMDIDKEVVVIDDIFNYERVKMAVKRFKDIAERLNLKFPDVILIKAQEWDNSAI